MKNIIFLMVCLMFELQKHKTPRGRVVNSLISFSGSLWCLNPKPAKSETMLQTLVAASTSTQVAAVLP